MAKKKKKKKEKRKNKRCRCSWNMELINNRSERLNRVLETIHVSSLREQRIKFQRNRKGNKSDERVYLFSKIRKV